ncbi:MAG: hypothetical protein ONB49_02870 [candidate division KSB1 bacterium]|nr:hypothetical protein [candidate division KSB1 bacterium]MDZ7305984.1 hypothetical protein [candidate division KSB1 bacterium]
MRAVCLLFPAMWSFLSTPGFAQEEEETKPTSPTPYRGTQYYLGDGDELLMKVNIWGFVRKPGQYMVPTDTDLIALMSFAGGPIEEARIKAIRIVRALNPAAARTTSLAPATNGPVNQAKPAAPDAEDSAPRVKVLTVDVKKFLETGDTGLIPALQPGDTIVVSGNSYTSIRKILDLVTRVAILGQLYFWLNR